MEISSDDKADLFTQYRRLAWKLAGKFHRQYSLPYEEVLEEAESVLGEVAARWDEGAVKHDPSKSNSTSWVYRCIYWHLVTFCGKRQRQPDKVHPSQHFSDGNDPGLDRAAVPNRLEAFLSELEGDARTILLTIMEAPAEIAEDLRPGRHRRSEKAINEYLRTTQNLTDSQLEQAWKQVSEVIMPGNGVHE